MYKITYHLDNHGKDHEGAVDNDGRPVRYRQVNGSSHTQDMDQDEDLWMESVAVEMLHSNGDKRMYETDSVGIQMGLPEVRTDESDDEEGDSLEGDSDDSIRHRTIT